jgi:hypothetical protein
MADTAAARGTTVQDSDDNDSGSMAAVASTSTSSAVRTPAHELLLNYHVKLDPSPVRFPGKFGTVYFDQCNGQLVITRGKEVKRIPIKREQDDVKISSITYATKFDTHTERARSARVLCLMVARAMSSDCSITLINT